MSKKYKVKLTVKDKKHLQELVSKGQTKARTITRCRILLLAGESKSHCEIVESLKVARNTIKQVCQRYKKEGLESAIYEKKRPGRPDKFTGIQRAKITALACTNPPDGRSRWTVSLLADKAVELKLVDDISDKTVERTLKKTK